MRGIIGVILAGLGAFLILVAVLLPTYVVGQAVKFPLNEYRTATLQASNASYFSAKTLSEQTGVTMQATYTIKTNPTHAGDSSTAVWDEFTWVEDITNNVPVQSQSRTFAFDRKTAQLVSWPGENVNGDTSVQQTGVVGYVFPMNTQRQTYMVFDATVNKPMPFAYSGTTTVDGTHAYEFTESYGATQTGTTPFPGNLVGSSAALVTLPEYTAMHVIYSVDPVTGELINVNEHETTTIRSPANGTTVTAFDADLAITPSSLATIVGLDNGDRNKITLLETILPIVAGAVGAVLLIAGIILAWRRRPEPDSADAGTAAHEGLVPAQAAGTAAGAEPTPATPAPETSAAEAAGPDHAGPQAAG